MIRPIELSETRLLEKIKFVPHILFQFIICIKFIFFPSKNIVSSLNFARERYNINKLLLTFFTVAILLCANSWLGLFLADELNPRSWIGQENLRTRVSDRSKYCYRTELWFTRASSNSRSVHKNRTRMNEFSSGLSWKSIFNSFTHGVILYV